MKPAKLAPLAWIFALLLVAIPPARAEASTPLYFPETGYAISQPEFVDFFLRRGGIRTFGYPVSRDFILLGLRVQVFQRHVMQLQLDGRVTTLNLLGEGLLPYTRFNQSIFPAPDPDLIGSAPSVNDADYDQRIVAFVREHAPDEWDGQPVKFYSTFLNTVRYEDAFPEGEGSRDLLPLLNLEIWGAPLSEPAYDPGNRNFIYQRFQRGIMHYDAGSGVTQGLLLADYFKAIITGRNLPPDLAEQARGSRFFQQYDNTKDGGLSCPADLPNTNLKDAFEPDFNTPYIVSLTPPAVAQPQPSVPAEEEEEKEDRPEGGVDSRISGQTFTGPFTIEGWAKDDSGIDRVEIIIDGVKRLEAEYGLRHEDPDCRRCGFRATIDPAALGLADGKHELRVRAVAEDDDRRTLTTRTFTLALAHPAFSVQWVEVSVPASMQPGQEYTAHVDVKNIGSVTWPNGGRNPVRFSYHWDSADGEQVVVWDGLRTPLDRDVAPKARTDKDITIRTPDQPGTYTLVLDLVQEGVSWFSQQNGATYSLRREVRAPAPYGVDWERYVYPATLQRNQTYEAEVTVINTGTLTWPAGGPNPVRLSYHWMRGDYTAVTSTQAVVWDGIRTPLPRDVPPGESITLRMPIRTPERSGTYKLVFDLLHSDITWFSREGAAVADLTRVVS